MHHVIKDMEDWLKAFDDDSDGYKDVDAIECIKKALCELEKYYTEHDNEDLRERSY